MLRDATGEAAHVIASALAQDSARMRMVSVGPACVVLPPCLLLKAA